MTRIAVAHYCEGAGHATRMLAVANELRERSVNVYVAGGGPGARFVRLHGYEEYEPEPVDYIGDFEDEGSILKVLVNSVPASVRRVRDYVGWLRRIDPEGVVTDDMFAAIAAVATGTPLFVLTHNAAFLYRKPLERVFTGLWTRFQLGTARAFLYPAVWPEVPGEPNGVVRIPPVALEGEDAGPDDPGVLVVPSYYSGDVAAIAERIRSSGRDVTVVGSEDWEPVPALLNVIERAEAVVCSGYSTVMETTVAGTPCVMYPRTDEQCGVARVLSNAGAEGFRVVDSPDAAVSALSDLPAASPSPNGAPLAATAILERL
jgi:hypothetical protein